MINKMRWKLIKPENDFIALEDELRNLHFAQRTYQMFGTRSPYVSAGDYSRAFEFLENVVKGTEQFVFWEPAEFSYGERQNVHSIKEYLRKDEDCGYLGDMSFIPIEIKKPVSLLQYQIL